MKFAFFFPGQGSQSLGMMNGFEGRAVVEATFDEASAALGQDLWAMMNGSDAILDQLYSYTPSMNPLEAMARGIICIGGGEPENYEIIHEEHLRPIINVQPNYESVYQELEHLVLHPELIPQLKQQSLEYISKHHEYIKVAKQYEEYYKSLLA